MRPSPRGVAIEAVDGGNACELNGAKPFDYLTELVRHAEELKRSPSEWMPWNYRENLARFATAAAA